MSSRQLFLVVATVKSAFSDGMSFSAVVSLLCRLVQTALVQLSFRLLQTAKNLFNLLRRKRLFCMAFKQHLR